jgi:TfuA protein
MKKPIVFLGPSLPTEAARKILDADYRPPVRRNDVVNAAKEKPPLIAMIDGVFMHTLAPSPHEVLRALQMGVPMMGSSSLGALRAVELAPFGMKGIGQIYDWFQTGELDADDEVALVFRTEDLKAISEPMVNIRYALRSAVAAAVLTSSEEEALIQLGKALYFPDRSWRRLFAEGRAVVGAATVDRLETFVREGDYDLKALDAQLLLKEAAAFMRSSPAAAPS